MVKRLCVGVALLLGCASSGGQAAGGATTSNAAANPATRAYGFEVAAMTVAPPTPPANGFVPTQLGADGRVANGSDAFGTLSRNRFVSPSGQTVLELAADGTCTLPWARGDGPSMTLRFTPQGLEVTNRGNTTVITMTEQGEYVENGTPTGGRVAPYSAAHRDTALFLRVAHALAFMHGMATSGQTAVTPAR